MLKFIAVQLVDDEDVEAMIYVICQSEILQYCELNANIELHTFPIPNPQPVPHQFTNNKLNIKNPKQINNHINP